MTKEFIPYEEALALKELGFDEPCLAFYQIENFEKSPCGVDDKDEYIRTGFATCKNSEIPEHFTSSPLFQQAFRWFREKHNLEYQIMKSANGNYSAVIHLNTQEYLDKISTLHHACVDEVVDCYSYEEAELACLRKLIEIVKK